MILLDYTHNGVADKRQPRIAIPLKEQLPIIIDNLIYYFKTKNKKRFRYENNVGGIAV